VAEVANSAERQALIGAVKLSAESVDGLKPMQIKLMRQTVVDVNEALGVAGQSIRSAMEDLLTLKKNVERGNWGAFLKSGVLNISPKAASDLVNAYVKWIGTDEGKLVKDYVLQAMTPRTLSAVANAPTEIRNEVQSIVISGNGVTEAEVRKLVGSRKRRTAEQKALTEALKDVRDESKGLVNKESDIDEAQQHLREVAEEYQSIVQVQKKFAALFKELKNIPVVNTKDPITEAYVMHLKKQHSKNVMTDEMLAFMFKLKQIEAGFENEKVLDAAKEGRKNN
jgi:hypothetical protein